MTFPRKENGRLDLVAYNRASQKDKEKMADWIAQKGTDSDKYQFKHFCEHMKQDIEKTKQRDERVASIEEGLENKGRRKKGGCNIL